MKHSAAAKHAINTKRGASKFKRKVATRAAKRSGRNSRARHEEDSRPSRAGSHEACEAGSSTRQCGYWRMDDDYTHNIVHLGAYERSNLLTNGVENFWSLLKRGINGTYVSVEPFHLFRYVDEQPFRLDNRLPMSDADRFGYLVRKIVGKRLTYKELIGKTDEIPIPF